jgi:acyl-CoA synthetase (AMP-forming)/AMP-acid ligase II
MGLAGGDRVAVLEDNCIEAADFYVGSVAANLVRVPLYRAREGHRVYPPGLDERHPRLVLPAAAGRPGRPVPARGPYFTRIGIPVPARVARRRLQHFVPALRRADVLEALSAEPVSYFFAVPTMVADLTRMAGGQRLDLPALKAVMVSGAPNSERTALAGHEVFGDTMYQMYGQTEAVPVTFMGPRTWFSQVPGSTPLRAAGQVMPFAELQIRGEDGEVLPIGEEGEISIRCDGQMTGIWNDEELTARRLRDGWVLTGDIGRLDENGFLYVVDRVDDLIVSGGFNIWPAELEQIIALMPPVREVAVFGVPDEKWVRPRWHWWWSMT